MGESLVGRAVRQLAQSVELVDEAAVHLRQAESSALDAFALYRQAADDVTMPEALDAIERSEHAVDVLRGVLATLTAAKEAVTEYVALIAPGLAFSDGKGVRPTPSGEDLASGVPATRGRAAVRSAVQRSDDVKDVIETGAQTAKQSLQILRPPEITGAHQIVDVRPSMHINAPPSTIDPVSATVFSLLAVGVVGRRVVRRGRRFLRDLFDVED